jgi:hypothetical protein
MRPRKQWTLGFLGILAAAALACESTTDLACTQEFRIYGVYVTDTAGVLLPGLDHSVIIRNIGQEIHVDSSVAQAADGWYPLISDTEGSVLGPTGALVTFVATDNTVTATGDFVFVAGPCHVEKLSGPDTVVAE